eukprot:Pgem_evm1s13930
MGVGSKKSAKVLEGILKTNGDIIVLQETHKGWENYLVAHLQNVYPHRIWRHEIEGLLPQNSKMSASAGGSAVLSKFPIKELFFTTPDVDGSFFP